MSACQNGDFRLQNTKTGFQNLFLEKQNGFVGVSEFLTAEDGKVERRLQNYFEKMLIYQQKRLFQFKNFFREHVILAP